MVPPIFKKGDQRVCSNYKGITLLSHAGKVYSRVLERRLRPIVENFDSGGAVWFSPRLWNSRPELLRGSWEYDHPVCICFVDKEKAYDCVSWGILWGVLQEA